VFDRPEVSISVLLEFTKLLSNSPVPIYSTIGNHDLFSYNLDTYERTSLCLLEMLVPQLQVYGIFRHRGYGINLPGERVWITFEPYTSKMDIGGYGYGQQLDPPNDRWLRIHVAHGLLLDHVPPFDRYTLVQDVETNADIILTGHCHTGYGVYKRKDGKVFCNPGSLLRSSASTEALERAIQVAVIDTETRDIELVPLKCAKPGNEVLDRSKIEADDRREYAMSEFAALIQTGTGEKAVVPINDIVETIAKQEGLPVEVIQKALEKIEEMKGMIAP